MVGVHTLCISKSYIILSQNMIEYFSKRKINQFGCTKHIVVDTVGTLKNDKNKECLS